MIKGVSEEVASKQLALQEALEKVVEERVKEQRGLETFKTAPREANRRRNRIQEVQELQALKASEDRALSDLQSKIQVVCRDAEASATSCRSMSKSMKHLEASLQDVRVSLDRHDLELTELKRDVQLLPACGKRVDDLWRHVEGLKSGAQPERTKELVESFEPRATRVRWPQRPASPRPEAARPEPVAVKRRDARCSVAVGGVGKAFGGFSRLLRALKGLSHAFRMGFHGFSHGFSGLQRHLRMMEASVRRTGTGAWARSVTGEAQSGPLQLHEARAAPKTAASEGFRRRIRALLIALRSRNAWKTAGTPLRSRP